MKAEALRPKITGGVRPVAARWVIAGDIVLKTATHFGGSGDSSVDMEILRDPRDGKPLLPGTSLAGALRGHLADVLSKYRSQEHGDVSLLFGAARRKEEGSQSPLLVFDSLGNLPDGLTVEIRDGVAIDPASGTAEAHKQFDLEVLPAGTVFPLRLELIIEKSSWEAKLLGLLVKTLEGLAQGDISLGARRSRGLGMVTAHNWRAVRYDLTIQEGWLKWLTADALKPLGSDSEVFDSPGKACQAAYPSITPEKVEDQRKRVIVEAELFFPAGILVRSPAAAPDAPDVVHLASGGYSVLPGTSLAGVLRNRALKIARMVRAKKNDAEDWVNRLFGPRPAEKDDSEVEPTASRLLVSESVIRGGTRRRPSRIRIDRFTQGVMKGSLFDEEPDYGGKAKVRLELREPQPGETGLLLLLLKDLLSGDLYVGGTSAVGRGVIQGTALVCFADGKKVPIGPELEVADEDRSFFNQMIAAFWGGAA